MTLVTNILTIAAVYWNFFLLQKEIYDRTIVKVQTLDYRVYVAITATMNGNVERKAASCEGDAANGSGISMWTKLYASLK